MSIIEKCKAIQSIRKNPLLVLILPEVKNDEVITASNLLYGKKFDEFDVIIETPGGDIESAFKFAKLLRTISDKVNFIVPTYAKSAGTLICLCGAKIILTELSELGPLDTQIREEQDGHMPQYTSALNGFKALEQVQKHTIETLDIATKLIYSRSGLKLSEAFHLANEFTGETSGTLYSQLNPKKIGEYARALEIGERYGKTILTRYKGWSVVDAEETVNKLVKGYPSHGYIIDHEELSSLKLPSEKADINLDLELMKLRSLLYDSNNQYVQLIETEVPKTIDTGDVIINSDLAIDGNNGAHIEGNNNGGKEALIRN